MQTTQQRAYFHHTRKKRECQRKKQQQRKKRRNRQRQEERNLMFRLRKTIDHHFPDLYEKIEAIPECRKQPDYSLLEIIMAGVAMFLFKTGSRNAMNNEREEPKFRKNYERLFKTRLPHMDTVEDVMEVLEAHHIEVLKTELVKGLLAKKILRRPRVLGHSYLVVIDGTHVMDVPEGHCPHCLHQTCKNGKVRYFHDVVEAKLVGDNGFCLSLATIWVENPEEYNKQDCEFKGFQRLAAKLKRVYPRLSICLVADGLYPNQTFFRICHEHGWSWIVTFKEGNLPSVWKRVVHRQALRHWQQGYLEELKTELIKGLLAKKILRRSRLLGQFYMVVIDGTHVMEVSEGHCEHCLRQTLKNGRVRYFHNVLEAKLVTDTGFCLSLASEWLENPQEYDKQDCELKAFARLARKLKQRYARVSLCIVADGLYPNQTFFRICREHGWSWIVTLKDGNLPSVWKRVLQRQALKHCRKREECVLQGQQKIQRRYEWHPWMSYQGFRVHWYTCEEIVAQECSRFVYLSSLEMDYYSILELTEAGRLRWKIENEGFDVQKHHGYGLGHQFSRRSMLAMKNYYQLMQMAHLFNQLFELSSLLAEVRGSKESLAHIWLCLVGELRHEVLDFAVLMTLLARRIRIRYD